MGSTSNLRSLGSLTVSTLYQGSPTERFVLGAALVGTGILIMHAIYSLACRIFAKTESSAPFPKFATSPEMEQALRRRLEEQYRIPEIAKPEPSKPPQLEERQVYSLLKSLSIHDQPLGKEQEEQLADAFHAYQGLKTNIGGDEGRFAFLAASYLQAGRLLEKLKWEERKVEIEIPPHFNTAFAELEAKLNGVRLSLKNVKTSDNPIAKFLFENGSSKSVDNLSDLYHTVKNQCPHILSSFEIVLKKDQLTEAKKRLHESRLAIIDKTLSTVRAVLIDDLVGSFSEKYKEVYAIFGDKPETVRFVLENICWHALDRTLESIEITFIPSKEKQKSIRKVDLEARVKRVFQDQEKRTQAVGLLIQTLEKPDNEAAVGSFVNLLSSSVSESNPERDALIKSVQEPELQLEEESVQLELARLEGLQTFYRTVKIAAAVADEGKNALLTNNGEEKKQEKLVFKALHSSEQPLSKRYSIVGQKSYAQQIDELSNRVVEAGEIAVKSVASRRWEDAIRSLDEELDKVPHLTPETRGEIIKHGWVEFKNRQALLFITGPERWLLTKKMIIQRLAKDSLEQKGSKLVEGVGKGVLSFITTAYGRLMTALLAFDKRTRDAQPGDPKPADRIATAFLEAFKQSCEALAHVKKDKTKEAGRRENEVVTELDRNSGLHPSASNKPSADAVFLGKLILELLSVLQPEGLTEEVRKILVDALSKPGEIEPSLIQKAIEIYTNKIRPAAGPWIKPVGVFLIQALENIIERQSTHNFASQLSDLLDPANINASLVDFLNPDKAQDKTDEKEEEEKKITITPQVGVESKERVKWYPDDEENLKKLLETRVNLATEITAFEKRFEELKKAAASDTMKSILPELTERKVKLAQLDLELVPELLRRLMIANVGYGMTGYAVQFGRDIFELIQYPRILRHIVFHVLEKSIQSLAKPLEESQTAAILDQPLIQSDHQSVFDFLFSDLAKTSLGNMLANLFGSVSAESNWSFLGMFVKGAAKTVVPGYFLFTRVQRIIEGRIQKKYKDPHASQWSVAKLVVTLTDSIHQFAKDRSDKGMSVRIAAQLSKAIGIKEKEEPALLS